MTDEIKRTPNLIIPVLVVALIGASFVLGTLWNKVQTLEKASPFQVAGTNVAAQPSAQPSANDQAAPPVKDVPKLSDADHIRGNKNAQIALIAYSDYECPFCKTFHATMQQVMKEYGDKVVWAYRHYPLSFHANAQKEAEAAECVFDQGGVTAFWDFTDKIYDRTTSNGTGFALDKLPALAAEVGVDQTKFSACLDSSKNKQKVLDSISKGSEAGVNGTPSTFIMDLKTGQTQNIPGALPFESVKTTLDQLLGS